MDQPSRQPAAAPPEGPHVTELLQQTLDGDRAACRALMNTLAPVIHHRVHRVLRRYRGERATREDALDLVQEVLVILLDRDARVLRTWRADGGLSVENFVGLVAEREVRSILRSGRRSAWAEDPTDDAFFSEQSSHTQVEPQIASRQFLSRMLERLRQELSPRGFALFEQLVVKERSVDDVAEQFGMSIAAIYTFRNRLKQTAHTIAQDLRGPESGAFALEGTGAP